MIEEGTGYYAVPCSVKVVAISNRRVLLGLNDRDEWELPGGWPDQTDLAIVDTAVREVYEETGLRLDTDQFTLVEAELFTPVPGHQVALVCFSTTVGHDLKPRRSAEHREMTWHLVTELPKNLPEIYHRFISASVDIEGCQVRGASGRNKSSRST